MHQLVLLLLLVLLGLIAEFSLLTVLGGRVLSLRLKPETSGCQLDMKVMLSLCVCVQRSRTGGGTVLHHPGVQGTKDSGLFLIPSAARYSAFSHLSV